MAKARKSRKSRKSSSDRSGGLPRVTRDQATRIQMEAYQAGLVPKNYTGVNLDYINSVDDPKVRKILSRLANDKLRSELKIAVGLSQLGMTQKQLAVAVRGLLDGTKKEDIEKEMEEVGPRKKGDRARAPFYV